MALLYTRQACAPSRIERSVGRFEIYALRKVATRLREGGNEYEMRVVPQKYHKAVSDT